MCVQCRWRSASAQRQAGMPRWTACMQKFAHAAARASYLVAPPAAPCTLYQEPDKRCTAAAVTSRDVNTRPGAPSS